MIRVECKNCGFGDPFGTLVHTSSGHIPKPKDQLYGEICNYFKIPMETIHKSKDKITVDYCLHCKPEIRGTYNYMHNVGGCKTVAKNRQFQKNNFKRKGGKHGTKT